MDFSFGSEVGGEPLKERNDLRNAPAAIRWIREFGDYCFSRLPQTVLKTATFSSLYETHNCNYL